MNASSQPPEFGHMDDSALLTWRAQARTELERLTPASLGHAVLEALYDDILEFLRERLQEM